MSAFSSVTPPKSPNDDREYRHITLPNKLQVLLVSDPTTGTFLFLPNWKREEGRRGFTRPAHSLKAAPVRLVTAQPMPSPPACNVICTSRSHASPCQLSPPSGSLLASLHKP